MKKLFLILLFTLCPIFVFAQFTENIRAEQPRLILNPHTIGYGFLQMESRLMYKSESNLKFVQANFLRYGLLENVEVNAIYDWGIYERRRSAGNLERYTFGTDLQLGFRLNLMEQKDYRPGIGFQYSILLKIGEDSRGEDYWGEIERRTVGSRLGIGMVQQIVPKLNAIGHFVIIWDDGWDDQIRNYIDVGYGFAYDFYRMSIFAEVKYSSFYSDFEIYLIGTGLTYRVKDNWNLNVSLGIDDNDITLGFGNAIRFGLKDPKSVPNK